MKKNGEANVAYPYNRILFSLKREGNPYHTMTWVSPEDITLSERSQTQKNKCWAVSLRLL
jgi:hypothetical protein